jgi:hypothetical protein
VILFTALIGPHFVDWTSYRQSFEREATAYVGRPVTVAGKASVRLLPTPVLSFTDINVGDQAAPDLKMERFRAEVELAPLLRGKVRIIQMTMERPIFYFDLAALTSGRGALAGSWRLDPERISLERLEIAAGSALVTDSRNGREWRAENLDAVVEADTLMGPGKVDAHFVLNGEPFNVTVGFGRFGDAGSVTAKASVHSPNYPVAVLTDGQLQLPRDAPPSYVGTATIVGVEPGDAATPRTHWADFRASGGFALQPDSLGVTDMQLSYGATERPLILQATGTLDLTDPPRFDLALTARQIDLDRSLGGGTEEPVAIESAVAALIDKLPGMALPPIPGKLHFEAQGAVVGGGVIQAVDADLETGEGGWRVDNFSATLPGETEIALEGMLGMVPDATFKGSAQIASRRPTALAGWWRGEVGSAARIGGFSIAADVDLQPGGQRLDNLAATTRAGTMNGTVDVKRDPQTGRAFVTIDLGADRADLVEARALAELLAGKGVAAANIEQMTLSLRADVLSAGDVDAQSVVVEGNYAGGELNVTNLSVADLAGANIVASASIRDPLGKPSGSIEASVRAEDFSGAASFFASLAPESRIARHLRDVAPILSPVVAEVSAEAGAGAGEKLALSLTGSFAATHLTLEAEGTGALGDPSSISGWLKLHADGEDSGTVIRQVGLGALPVRSSPLNLDADFEGAVAAGGELRIGGTIAGVALSYDGTTALKDGAPSIAGVFSAESADLDPALLLAGIAVPGVGEGHPAAASGSLEYADGAVVIAIEKAEFAGEPLSGAFTATFVPETKLSGALELASASAPGLAGLAVGTNPGVGDTGWSGAAFAAAIPPDVALDLTLDAATLDVGAPIPATDAKLALQFAAGKLHLDLASAVFAGGVLKGALTATVANGEVDLALRGGLQGGALEDLVWNRSGLPIASGMLDASFDLVGRGRSTAGIVATLAGSGSFSVESGRVNALNPEALTAVMAAAEGKDEPDETKARETFATLFGSGALDLGRAAGSFSIANGIMTIPTVSLEAGTTAILADATFDLSKLTLQSQWVVRSGEVGADQAQPYVPIRFSGAIADPDRQIDVDPLLNLMRSRFLQRQLKELEALEEARRRFEAEEAARKAEEERRAAEEAAEPQADRAPDTAAPDASPIAAEPLVAPQTLAPPIDLVPELPPEPTPAPAPSQAIAPRPSTVQPATPPPPRYRTLPNGTIVKIR